MPKLKRQRLDEQGQDRVTASDDENPATHSVEYSTEPQKPRGGAFGKRSLFVRSLPPTVSSESLAAYFSESYPLKHATVVYDKATKQSKCFGFVTFADAEDAGNAQKDFNGAEFSDRKIKVEMAEPRHRQQVGDSSVSEIFPVDSKPSHQVQAPPKLIVRNVPWTINNEDQLTKLFMSYGKVKHISIPKKGPGLSAGFAFVVLRGRKNAERALRGLNGREVQGRTLAIDWAVDKQLWQSTQQVDNLNVDSEHHEENMKSEIEEETHIGGISDDDAANGGKINTLEASQLEMESTNNIEAEKIKVAETAAETSTLFVRNIPFDVDDNLLRAHFAAFGPVRYARIVVDQATERPKGTGFVSFYTQEAADLCLHEAPRSLPPTSLQLKDGKTDARLHHRRSLLEDATVDQDGKFILKGRVLQVSRAVTRQEAAKLTFVNSHLRDFRDKDRRHLYLLSEGAILSNNPFFNNLSPSDIKMRDESSKQRQMLIRSNPSLHLSFTRLSVRNLPRSMTSKTLKSIAREAVVGFASDVKSGLRKQLTKEELARSGYEMKQAERDRKAKGKGVVKQAKVVFEGQGGGKVTEGSGAGRSRGYGFIEYSSHRWALMGLRWLNGRALNPPTDTANPTPLLSTNHERKKRLIVEFAIENAQVVMRRRQREDKARARSRFALEQRGNAVTRDKRALRGNERLRTQAAKGSERERPKASHSESSRARVKGDEAEPLHDDTGKATIRQTIIRRKRINRQVRKNAA